MAAQITHLYLKPGHKQPMTEVQEATADDGQGLVGDLSYGVKKRQILLIEQETLEAFGLEPGQIRENVTVRGIHLAGLEPGSRLQAGLVVLEVTGDCAPCQFIEDIRNGLRSEIEGRRGTFCRVVSGGRLRPHDPIQILEG
jgi:MOSC domain-containing protein YiiM